MRLLTNNPEEYDADNGVGVRCCVITSHGQPHVGELQLADRDQGQEGDVGARVTKEARGGRVQQQRHLQAKQIVGGIGSYDLVHQQVL